MTASGQNDWVTPAPAACSCKVGKVVRRLDIPALDTDIRRRWLGEGCERQSLRALADVFNRTVLRETLEAAESGTLDAEIATTYRLLTEDDDENDQTAIRRRLEEMGVEIEPLLSAFVSYQTINRHLKQCCRIAREETDETDIEYVQRRVQAVYALENRTEAVSRDIIQQLDSSGRISLSDFDVEVGIDVQCSNCGAHHTISDIVENRGCHCSQSE